MEETIINVLIVDDIEPLRQRYAFMLSSDPSIRVIGQASTKAEAIEAALHAEELPDVILMDIDMDTPTAGLDASREILEERDVKVVILTVCDGDENVFIAFQLGVADYILKDASSLNLIACVKDAYYGRSPIRPLIATKIRSEFQRIRNSEQSFLYCLQIVSQLTQTELDILNLINQGYTRQKICEVRCVELSTVKTQIHKILKKFDCASTNDLLKGLNDLKIFDYMQNLQNKNFPQ